jgi:hypothetical protein
MQYEFCYSPKNHKVQSREDQRCSHYEKEQEHRVSVQRDSRASVHIVRATTTYASAQTALLDPCDENEDAYNHETDKL